MIQMDGKVAIVTGGATGIGAATAQKLCDLGASVAILDRNAEAAKAVVDALQKAGHKASFHICDISVETEVQDAISSAAFHYGALHILVSNAGVQRYGDVVNTTAHVWDETFDVDRKSVV